MQERLLRSIIEDRVPHAILISGPEGSGRRELARRAAALYCLGEDAPERLANNPNYLEVGDGAVKVEDIRTLLASAAMQGFNGGRRAFVFLNAQNMSAQIQNTLLKTLEAHAAPDATLRAENYKLANAVAAYAAVSGLAGKTMGI